MLEHFQPTNPVITLLVRELVSSYWRLQRPRRYETAAIRRARDTAWYRLRFETISEINSLKARFIRDFSALCSPTLVPPDPAALGLSLEETRKQLERKSLGLEFLIDLIECTRKRAEEHGYLSPADERMLVNVCGVEDTTSKSCLMLNQIANAELEKFKKNKSASKKTFELTKRILSMRLRGKTQDMQVLKRVIEQLEATEEEAHLATLVMPPPEFSEKIQRAEAALARYFLKILSILLAPQGVEMPG